MQPIPIYIDPQDQPTIENLQQALLALMPPVRDIVYAQSPDLTEAQLLRMASQLELERGNYGKYTAEAVATFKRQQGLDGAGRGNIDSATAARLNAILAAEGLLGDTPQPHWPGGNEHAAAQLLSFLLDPQSLAIRTASMDLKSTLQLVAATGGAWSATAIGREQVAAIGSFLEQTVGSARPRIPESWLSADAPAAAVVSAYRGRAAQVISVGALLTTQGEFGPRQLDLLLAGALGIDRLHRAVGDLLGAYRLPLEPPLVLPNLSDLDRIFRVTCISGIRSALHDFGAIALDAPRKLPGAVIESVEPDQGCRGTLVTLRGTGFGAARPDDVQVLFSTRDGGCAPGQISGWTDTQIYVSAPDDVGHGCIALWQTPEAYGGLFEATDTLAGALEICFGPQAGGAARHIRQFGSGSALRCPPCDDPVCTFSGGPPRIDTFTVDGGQRADIRPGAVVTLAWRITGARLVTIAPVEAGLPAVTGVLAVDAGQVPVGPLALQDGQTATYRLLAENGCGPSTALVRVSCVAKVALVLGGGGAKGAFEVGAVRCLHDVKLLRPTIIAGASAGALNAAKLAEGDAALAQLEALWLGLTSFSDFYRKPPWFMTLEPLAQSLLLSDSSNLGTTIGRAVANIARDKILGVFFSFAGLPGWVYTVLTSLYPVVTHVIDAVRWTEAASQAMNANSLFDSAPLAALIAQQIDPVRVAASGIALRITMVSLEHGTAVVVDQNSIASPGGEFVPLPTALLASASIPIAFPPVAIANIFGVPEHFIDGGTRNNVPVRMAVEAGADRIYAVLASPRGMAVDDSFGGAKMLQIAARALDIVLDEMQEDDLAPFGGFAVPLTTIAPSFLVHDTLTVDPGLIAINMDYGYMCAFDDAVAATADHANLRAIGDRITLARIDAWAMEHHAMGERLSPPLYSSEIVPVSDAGALQQVRDLKAKVRALTLDRGVAFGDASLPRVTAPWWQAFERHAWVPSIDDPWQAFHAVVGDLEAAPVPPALPPLP